MNFNEEYYQKVIGDYKYNPLDFAPLDFNFFSIPKETMRLKWLCHSGIDKITSIENTIVTTGVGLSGIPHMGTLSQILRSIFLQQSGIKVQLVLGDLDSYNARNKSLSYVMELSERYKSFVYELGFDANDGVLRDQISHPEINQYAYILSKHLSDVDFLETEEDLSELYIRNGVYNGITFPVKQAILLMVSDFIFLGDKEQYNNVVVMLGLEEHKYVLMARKVIERMQLPLNLYSMYSRIIRGLNGYPKMSKSIKGSAITVDMEPSDIRNLINNESDDYAIPEDSVVFQMMSSVSDYSTEELLSIYCSCKRKDTNWIAFKKNYSERLVRYCSKWK